MEKLYATNNDEHGLYFQIEIGAEMLEFISKIADMIFDESYMVDDHYMGEVNENDQFRYSQDGIHLVIVTANKRAHVSVLGIPEKLRSEVKDFVFENYAF